MKTSGNQNNLSKHFPAFMWIVRDFALKMEDKHGMKISPKEYLENALTEQKGLTDKVENKNRIRR